MYTGNLAVVNWEWWDKEYEYTNLEFREYEHTDLEFRVVTYRDMSFEIVPVYEYQAIVTGPDGYMAISRIYPSRKQIDFWILDTIDDHNKVSQKG